MGGYVEPLQEQGGSIQARVPAKESLVVEPHNVIVFYVMTEVLRSDVFETAVTGAANPTQQASQLGVVLVLGKQRVVGTFVDQVGGDDHAVSQQQHPWQESRPASGQQAPPARAVGQEHVQQG